MIIASIAIVGAMLLLSAWAWVVLPADARVPIHWGAEGGPDGWADKTVGLLLPPAIAAAVATLFALIPRFEPRRANLERSGTSYRAIWLGVLVLLAGVHVVAVGVALGASLDVSRLVIAGVGILFVVIGNYLPKVRPNYLMGIRAPWTLSSDLAWTRTHRLGGRLFVAEGVALALLGLAGVSGTILAVSLIAAIAVLLVVLFGYSYQVWKTDPDRRTA